MIRNILISLLVVSLLCMGYLYEREIEELGARNDMLISDNAFLAFQTSNLQLQVNRRDEVIQELQKLKGVVVSEITYYAPTGNKTKTGTVPEAGRTVAVDPNVIPLGSDVYIEGLGWRTAEDTGGAIDDTDVDVFVDTKEEATRGGRHHAFVLVR